MIKDWFETHWKKVLVHGLILSGFLVYALFFAGPLFSKFEVLEGESQLSLVSLPPPTNNIQYNLERFSVSDYGIEAEGWAFIEGQTTENSQIYVVLQSAENTYVFETSSWQRPNITPDQEVLDLGPAWTGFVGVIPLRKIEEGGYNLGLYIKKVGVEALQYTDRGVVKSKGVTEVSDLWSTPQEISLPPPTNNIRYDLAPCYVSGYGIDVRGWAFIEGQSAENSKIYVVLKSDKNTYVFDTMLQERPDITTRFGQLDLNLDNSGFIARILVGSVEKGTYRLGIYIRNGDIEAICFTDRLIDL